VTAPSLVEVDPVPTIAATVSRSVRDDRLSLILELGSLLHREVGFDELFRVIGERVATAMGAERATVFLVDASTGELRSHVASPPVSPEIRLARGQGIVGAVALSGKPILVPDTAKDSRFYGAVDKRTGFTTRNVLAVPIIDAQRVTRGVLQIINHLDEVGHTGFDDEDVAFLSTLAAQIALLIQWTTLRSDDAPRGVWVRGPYNRIVGDSQPMRRVYERLERAAATDVTVLLRGETGTGKGLVARALHANGARRDRPFVTVDCTTLPGTLIESELFGYERGAFTGADRRVHGKIEGADGGTLFLDEIGELALPAQAKLLRLLQERCFERVGGRETVTIDVRIVAATHRDLEAEVARGTFRADLLYRLRVVELPLPSLRERGETEIIALARHFLGVHSRRHARVGLSFEPEAEVALARHRWPGNVRELEHAVERAVVLAEDVQILPEHLGLSRAPSLPPSFSASSSSPPRDRELGPAGTSPATVTGVLLPHGLTLDEATRRYVNATVQNASGNRSEAARILGVGRNTLARKTSKP
jgi:DNA-binding NtrC family response regulator